MHPSKVSKLRESLRNIPRVGSSIRTRLTLSHLAVIGVAMALSGFLLLSFLNRYFLQAMEGNLFAQAQITAQTLIPGAEAIGGDVAAPPAAVSNTLRQQLTGNRCVRERARSQLAASSILDQN